MDQNSAHVVSIIKNKIDTVDPYYIYKINDRRWNGSGTYVFKSSQTATEIGLAMDRTAQETPFKDLVAHMDGLHSPVKGFITLTLWVKNPVSLITHRLCCMECESEDTENVTHFLNLFNEILRKVKKDPTFVWVPRGIMMDENGANKNAVNAVFGESMANRIWSCTCTICDVHDDRASSLVEMTRKLSSIWPNLWPKMQFPLHNTMKLYHNCAKCVHQMGT